LLDKEKNLLFKFVFEATKFGEGLEYYLVQFSSKQTKRYGDVLEQWVGSPLGQREQMERIFMIKDLIILNASFNPSRMNYNSVEVVTVTS
jgi:hypothetical protein